MSLIEKMSIRGIRSFSPDRDETLEFSSASNRTPLTMVLGKNGCGKTTIIECLRFALCGSVPPNADKGQSFVHDPRVSQVSEVKAKISVRFRAKHGQPYVTLRCMEVKLTGNGKKLTFKQLDGSMRFVEKNEKKTMSHKCSELDESVPRLLGASKAIIESVIFCHQEDSSWPFQGPKILKERFDAIFDASRYTKALDDVGKQKKKMKDSAKELYQEMLTFQERQQTAERTRTSLEQKTADLRACEEKIDQCEAEFKKFQARCHKITTKINSVKKKQWGINEAEMELRALEKDVAREEEKATENKIFTEDDCSDDDLARLKAQADAQDASSAQAHEALEDQKAVALEKRNAARANRDAAQHELSVASTRFETTNEAQHALENYVATYNTTESMASTTQTMSLDADAIIKILGNKVTKAEKKTKIHERDQADAIQEKATLVAQKETAVEQHKASVATLQSTIRDATKAFNDADRGLKAALGAASTLADKLNDVDRAEAKVAEETENLEAEKSNRETVTQEVSEAIQTADADDRAADAAIALEERARVRLQESEGAQAEVKNLANAVIAAKRGFKTVWAKEVSTIYPVDTVKAVLGGDDDDLPQQWSLEDLTPHMGEQQLKDLDLEPHVAYVNSCVRAVDDASSTLQKAEEDAKTKEYEMKATLQARSKDLKDATTKFKAATQEAKAFEGDDHPQSKLESIRTHCNQLLRNVFGTGSYEMAVSGQKPKQPDQEIKIAGDDISNHFERSLGVVKDYPRCLEDPMTKKGDDDGSDDDDDNDDEETFLQEHYSPPDGGPSALVQTMTWIRAFDTDLQGFVRVRQSEGAMASTYVRKFEKREKEIKCPVCRRKFNLENDEDQEDLKKAREHVKKMENDAKINLSDEIKNVEALISELLELQDGSWKNWGDTREAVVAAKAKVETCQQAEKDASGEVDAAKAAAAESENAAGKVRQLNTTLVHLQSLGKDVRTKITDLTEKKDALDQRKTSIGGAESGSSSVAEAQAAITKLQKQKTACAERRMAAVQRKSDAEKRVTLATDRQRRNADDAKRIRDEAVRAKEMKERMDRAKRRKDDAVAAMGTADDRTAELEREVDEARADQEKVRAEGRSKQQDLVREQQAAHEKHREAVKFKEDADNAQELRISLAKDIEALKVRKATAIQDEKDAQTALEDLEEEIQRQTSSIAEKETYARRLNDTLHYRKIKTKLADQKAHVAHLKAEFKKGDDAMDDDDDDDDGKLPRKLKDLEALLGDLQSKSRERENTIHKENGKRGTLEGQIDEMNQTLKEPQYDRIDDKYVKKRIDWKTTDIAAQDLDTVHTALTKTMQDYHGLKIKKINDSIKEHWITAYQGEDIDSIAIVSGEDSGSTKATKSYNYQVQMTKNDAHLDMRGRCSAGQRVLASIVIRLALAQTFCLNCGVLALDEPTTNLDAPNRVSLAKSLANIISGRSKQSNFQLIIITHDEEFITAIRQQLLETAKTTMPEYFYRVEREQDPDNGKYYSRIRRVDIDELPI